MNDRIVRLRLHDPIDLMGIRWCLHCHDRWPCAEGLRLGREAEHSDV